MARNINCLLLLVGLAAYGANAQSYATFADFISSYNGTDLTVFSAALNKTGLASALDSINGTVFIPNDAAFASFATSLGLANAAALLNLSQDVVASLLKFHVVPRKINVTASLVLVSSGLLDANGLANLYNRLDTLATPVAGATLNLTANLTDLKSSTISSPRVTAKLVSTAADPFTGVASSRVAIVSEVLAYWYQSIQSAISDNSRLNQLQRALINNGMWSELSDTSLSRSVFAPTDGGLLGVNNDFKIDMSANSSVAKELLTYMQAYGAQVTNYSADVSATYNYTSLFSNSSSITANQTGASKVAVSSIGSITKIDYPTIQIGGPTPKSFVYLITYPLIPKITNIWQMIQNEPSLSTLVGLFLREGTEYKKLAAITVNGQTTTSTTAYTLIAPNNAAFTKFANTYGTVASVANLTNLIGASTLGAFLRNHIVVGSYATGNLTNGVQLTTLQQTGTTKKVVVTTSGSNIMLTADKTMGTLVAPFNTAVAYGWTYIQVIDYPLVPEAVSLPNPGSAGAVLPSVVVLLMGLVAALMMI